MAATSRGHSILNTLNQAQCRAVSSDASTVAILAGPGSGKTHTLTSRVVWLIDVVGYRPQDVVVATFTVKAAREMRERIGKALGVEREKKIVLGTFHSISRRYLAAYGKKIGLDPKFGIADDGDTRAIINRICKRLRLGIDPAMVKGWISKKKARAEDEIAPRNGDQNTSKASHAQDMETCYEEYQKHLERSNLLDYDDLLVRCVDLLRRAPECVSNVQAVLIDEYQDTNGVQYELMKLMAQRSRRITVVGDPDQSIYGWRSADTRNLSRMFADFPATDKVALEENYRSSERILETSLKVIQQDEKRFEKVLKAVHTRGTKPVLRKLRSLAQEAEWIVGELRRAILLSGNMMTHDDIAILLRSASLSRHIENALGKAGIPYRMVGGFKFYERAEIKVILDYLRVIYQPDNNDALARIINVPKRGIGDVTVKALVEEAEQSSQSLWSVLFKHSTGIRRAKTNIRKQVEQSINAGLIRLILDIRKRMEEDATTEKPFGMVDVINLVLARLDFQQYLKDTYPEEYEGRWANVEEFVNLAIDFTKETDKNEETLPEVEGLEQAPETQTLPKFLANVALATDVQKEDADQEAKPLVTVSTIHAAKGLEWPIVFIPAAYNGSIPHMRSDDGDEERRLLYVAMTRAKALLYLSYPLHGSYGNGERVELSSFLSGPVSAYFAKHGPSFDKCALDEIGRILRREVPPQEKIYGTLRPFEVGIEDDTFPDDPEENREEKDNPPRKNGLTRTNSESAAGSGARPAKRQRFSASSGGLEQLDQEWHQAYATTMDQSSRFTVAALPGFVSAGTHHSSSVVAKKGAPKTGGPSGQRSLLGFVSTAGSKGQTRITTGGPSVPPTAWPTNPRGTRPSRPGVGSHAPPRPPGGQPTWGHVRNTAVATTPGIDPALANRRIGAAAAMMKPSRAAPAVNKLGAAAAAVAPAAGDWRHGGEPRNQYAQFSSSPSKPASDGAEKDAVGEPPPEPTRAAACFHTTTCTMPKGIAGLGGIKRPAGLMREGIAPMDRLRKPFKPLTINRP